MAELFGFSISKIKKQADPKQAFTTSQADDGTQTVNAGGHFGSYLDMEGTAKTEQDLVRRYREIALHPECDMAIEDIVNEAIVANELKDAVRVNVIDLPYGKEVRKKIEDEFQEVLRLMNFNTKGHDIFRRWYVDGRVYYQKVIDRESPKKGITELKYIDPRKIKKIREVRKKRPDTPMPSSLNSLAVVDEYVEYFLYNERGLSGTTGQSGIKIAPDTIAFCASGMIDQNKNMVLSYLHKAIKPVNQLRMIEDSAVIYRIARAPERRIFKIDVGNLPKVKAEQYLRDVMARYRNKLVYDANTGEIRDDRNYMSMLEDFWLPSREGGRGTDISTLPGGQNLGEISDIEYFRAKLYRSLNVPTSRLEASQGFNLGRASEITRDELKFTKFVQRLRKKFTELFNDILRTQLVLKGIIAEEDWYNIRDTLQYDFLQDGHFAELKHTELMRERLALANEMRDYVGKFFSVEYVRKNILKQNDREIENMDKQIKKEIKDGIIQDPMAQVTNNDDTIV
ncbi:portal protein [Amylibacter sp.]|nr:portal protein [Amylibacter sp.]